MSSEDNFLELPEGAATQALIWGQLSKTEEIGEGEIYAAAVHIYAKLISVPRSFQEQNLLDLTYKELGFKNATHAFLGGAVDAAFILRVSIKKRLEEEEGGEPNDGTKL